jgi:hypothetical protein
MYKIMLVTNITIKASPAVKDVNFLIFIFSLSKSRYFLRVPEDGRKGPTVSTFRKAVFDSLTMTVTKKAQRYARPFAERHGIRPC